MDIPNPKRSCHAHSVTSSIENPYLLPNAPSFNQSNIDMTISSFLSLSDLPMFSSPLSIECSFDRELDKVINSAAGTSHNEQDCFLNRTLQLTSLLEKSTKRCIRKLATLQNSISWPLLPELTTKVFSMLDTKSLMQASACCTMFNKSNLRSLHLYGVKVDCKSLYPVLSACSNLTDLKIVGLGASHTYRDQLELLGLLTRSCRLIEHLFIEIHGLGLVKRPPMFLESLDECPNLISLSLLGFRLDNTEVQKVIKSFPQLQYLNFSSSLVSKSFLRELGLSCKDSPLETLILRDSYLEEVEVLQFLNSLLAGEFKSIRLVDVSNIYGLISDGGSITFEPRLPIEELKKQRPEVTLLANFGSPSRRILKYNIDEEYYYYEEEEDWGYYYERAFDYNYDGDLVVDVDVEEDDDDDEDDDDEDDDEHDDDDEDEDEYHDDDEDGDEHGDEG